jgi:hypothetical protein
MGDSEPLYTEFICLTEGIAKEELNESEVHIISKGEGIGYHIQRKSLDGNLQSILM